MEFVQLVDESDNEIGVMEKISAHRDAHLHRAISVFIFNSKGEMLLQQRAAHKYHSAMLWTNAACTHPRPNETVLSAANRRLKEEMGMHCTLHHQFSFIYKAVLDNDLTEHEYDHVFFGETDELPIINTDEVHHYQYLTFDAISDGIKSRPDSYTAWFKIIFDRVKKMKNELVT